MYIHMFIDICMFLYIYIHIYIYILDVNRAASVPEGSALGASSGDGPATCTI